MTTSNTADAATKQATPGAKSIDPIHDAAQQARNLRHVHLNEVLLDGLRGNRNAQCFALMYSGLDQHPRVVEYAQRQSNLTVLAWDGAVVGTRIGGYRAGTAGGQEHEPWLFEEMPSAGDSKEAYLRQREPQRLGPTDSRQTKGGNTITTGERKPTSAQIALGLPTVDHLGQRHGDLAPLNSRSYRHSTDVYDFIAASTTLLAMNSSSKNVLFRKILRIPVQGSPTPVNLCGRL